MKYAEVKEFILNKLKNELPDHLSYHSVGHVKDVVRSCKEIADREDISNTDLTLLLTAALFHDSGFLINSKNHEELSCGIAKEHLPDYGYNNEDIERICGMIRATKVPQKPQNHLEEIICDADLDYLGRDDFFTIGGKLFDELCVYGILSTEDEWNELQVKFLEAHHYFTKTAIELRQKKKDENLAAVKAKLGK